MALVTSNQYQLVPDVGGSINQGLQLAGNVQALQAQQQQMDATREKQRFDNVSRWALQLQSIKDPQQKVAFLENQKNQNTLQGLDSMETQEVLDAYKSGDPEKIQAAENDLNSIIDVGVRMGSIKPPPQLQGLTESASGGFVGVDPVTRQAVAIDSPVPLKSNPEGITNVVFPDGKRQAFRNNDPNLDAALKQGATKIGQTLQSGSADDFAAAPKGAQASMFKDVVAGQQNLDQINQIETLYEPEFLTFKGSAKGSIANFMNKLDPEQRSQFQQRRAAFKSAANRNFLAFRKWATGVAGGEKEMAEIKRATFSEDDSPQDFESKLQFARSLYRRLNARNKAALKAGIDNDKAFKEYIKANPLDNIPTLQQRGEQLESQDYKQEQIIQLLKEEGYINQ